jgi:predicted transposase YdaD
MDMISTIVVYKFTQLSRQEVDAMLGVRVQETRVYQEAREEGREEEARSLILRQIDRRAGKVPEPIKLRIGVLSLAQLENLGVALMDFATIADLETWLATNA